MSSDFQGMRGGVTKAEADSLQRNPVDGVPTFTNTTVVDHDASATPPRASSTLTGADSAEVHQSLGQPGSGMSSAEERHNGQSHRKKQGAGGHEQWGTQAQRAGHEKQRDFDMNPPAEEI